MMGRSKIKRCLCISVLSAVAALMWGCEQERARTEEPGPVVLEGTIGSFARLYEFGTIPVKGWGIVAGLAGTGSQLLMRDVEEFAYIKGVGAIIDELDARRGGWPVSEADLASLSTILSKDGIMSFARRASD